MGKEKSYFSSKNDRGSRKSLLCAEKKHKSKKTIKPNKHRTKETDNEFDVDLSKHLTNGTKRNKLNVTDEKRKLLKNQVIPVFGDIKTDKISDCLSGTIFNSEISGLHKSHRFKKSEPLVLGSNCVHSEEKCESVKCFHFKNNNFKPIFISTPAKSSDKVKACTKIFVDNEEQNEKNLLLNIESQNEICLKSDADFQINKFNVALLSQQKIEELLYRSFIKQNFSFCDKNDSELKKTTTKTRKGKSQKPKKQSKNYNPKLNQQNLKKYYGSTQRGKKRRRTDSNSLLSDVEVIDLDTSSCFNGKPTNNTISIDLNVEDYDWNEPFDLTSDPEVIEICEKKAPETQELKFNDSNTPKIKVSYCNNEKDKSHVKKVWECPICFEQSEGQEVVATQCGHIFCKKCLENHFSKFGKICPSCCTNVKKKPFITLFNF